MSGSRRWPTCSISVSSTARRSCSITFGKASWPAIASGKPPAAPDPVASVAVADTELEALQEIQQRVLWLAVRMVDAANHERADAGGIKVGGHQASSASMVSIMTALWFAHLGPDDRVSVKPHASL